MRIDVESFLRQLGLQVISETTTEVVLYCPFHHNVDTPSFSINKKTGLWQCFNPSCGKQGRFQTLTRLLRGEDIELEDNSTYDDILSSWSTKKQSQLKLDNVLIDYDNDEDVALLAYLLDRGFTKETLKFFEVGFSRKRNRIVIPVRNLSYEVVGFIGRSVTNDHVVRYLYSRGFPRREILFNLQNAKQYNKVIVTEGSLDAINVHQNGYPNVVATLGSKLSQEQADLLNKYFDDIVIFSDNDQAGRELARAIMEQCPRKGMEIVVYPNGVKDPGEMNIEQITQCIENAVDDIEYVFHLEKL